MRGAKGKDLEYHLVQLKLANSFNEFIKKMIKFTIVDKLIQFFHTLQCMSSYHCFFNACPNSTKLSLHTFGTSMDYFIFWELACLRRLEDKPQWADLD